MWLLIGILVLLLDIESCLACRTIGSLMQWLKPRKVVTRCWYLINILHLISREKIITLLGFRNEYSYLFRSILLVFPVFYHTVLAAETSDFLYIWFLSPYIFTIRVKLNQKVEECYKAWGRAAKSSISSNYRVLNMHDIVEVIIFSPLWLSLPTDTMLQASCYSSLTFKQ